MQKMRNGLKNKNPKTPLAWALHHKKTIRLGSKADPFQLAELAYGATRKMMEFLIEREWSFVIQTRCTSVLARPEYHKLLERGKHLITLLPYVSPGLDADWASFERKRTTRPMERLKWLQELSKAGHRVGVNGEPFIPGHHTVEDFENTLKTLKDHGLRSYSVYNLHMNDLVVKRMAAMGLDIEKIWRANKDANWRPVLQKLLALAKRYDIVLGCPDFVNSGPDWREEAGTCCGIDVPNPTTFNTHHWKRRIQDGEDSDQVLEETWDGVGDFEVGRAIVEGWPSEFYTLADAGVVKKPGEGNLGL